MKKIYSIVFATDANYGVRFTSTSLQKTIARFDKYVQSLKEMGYDVIPGEFNVHCERADVGMTYDMKIVSTIICQ